MKNLRGVILLLALSSACKKADAPAPRRPAAAKAETPLAAKGSDDLSWLAGIWKKQGQERWLLFNPPADVAELAGRPPSVVRKGRLSVQGNYLSAVFSDGAYDLEATPDHAELSGAPGVYRRGLPP